MRIEYLGSVPIDIPSPTILYSQVSSSRRTFQILWNTLNIEMMISHIPSVNLVEISSLFEPRRTGRARSRKQTTVTTRNREQKLSGIQSAVRKIQIKWRGRLFRWRAAGSNEGNDKLVATCFCVWRDEEIRRTKRVWNLLQLSGGVLDLKEHVFAPKLHNSR